MVVKPDEGVSTREAYAGVRPQVPDVPLAERLRRPVTEWQGLVTNDFEESVFCRPSRHSRCQGAASCRGGALRFDVGKRFGRLRPLRRARKRRGAACSLALCLPTLIRSEPKTLRLSGNPLVPVLPCRPRRLPADVLQCLPEIRETFTPPPIRLTASAAPPGSLRTPSRPLQPLWVIFCPRCSGRQEPESWQPALRGGLPRTRPQRRRRASAPPRRW